MLTSLQPHFANRKEEISGVKRLVAQVKSRAGSPYYCIVNFYGVTGVGKSTLLTHIHNELRSESLPCALIDFAGGKYGELETAKIMMLEHIVIQLNISHKLASASEFENVIRRYWDGQRQVSLGQTINFNELVQQLVFEFTSFVRSLLIVSPVILLLDTTEEGDKILPWLQKTIIGELILQAGFLLIIAGRQPMKIEDGRLLPRMARPLRLSPFTLESIQDQIPEYAHLAGKILPITFGHPLANVIVANKLRQMESEIAKPIDEITLNTNLNFLSRHLCESLIQEKFLPNIDNDVLVAFRIVSLVRRFDLYSLQKLLEKQPDFSQDRINATFCLFLLQRMQVTGVVEWDSARKGYTLDETIRRQFAFEMFLNNKEKFSSLNQTAIEIYSKRIKEHPGNKIIYLLELLFHSAKSIEAQGADSVSLVHSLSSMAIEGLNYICRIERGIDLIPAIELFEELQRDSDLRQICDQQFNKLVLSVHSFITQNQ